MLSTTTTLGINGLDAEIIKIESDLIKGLPGFTIVGLPDSTIRESKDRIRSAIENSNFEFPPKNFIINLAPAGFKKQGANFDLPIAISILHRTGQLENNVDTTPMVGELSLDGSVRPVKGLLSMAIKLYKSGYKSMIVPYENRHEASAIKELKIFPVKNIHEVILVLNNNFPSFIDDYKADINFPYYLNFSDVKGQENAKRVAEISATGHHNILLYGSPGSGKTMIAKRMPSIMPDLEKEESIKTTMIHSVGSKSNKIKGLIRIPPFQSPHHTSSDAALIGGGRIPSVGEISLAHNGILFLDEFIQFKNNVIQALRQPLEDKEVSISRASGSYTFPADFILVAASNPCQCGHLFDPDINCSCSELRVRSYFDKIAGPILDRIDMEVLVNRVDYKDLLSKNYSENSTAIKERVSKGREIQRRRFQNIETIYNGNMNLSEIKEFCKLDSSTESILEKAVKQMHLSARGFFKILKVARTIADLDNKNDIQKNHIFEALSYKNLHRNYDV